MVAAVIPVWIGFALATHETSFQWIWVIPILIATLLIQIGTNISNDYFDWKKGADTAERIGPTRVTQSGLLSPNQVKLGFIIAFALAIVVGIPLALRGGWIIVFIGLSSVLLGIFYTAGPFAIAYRGLSEIFVILYFGIVAVTGTEYLLTLSWDTLSIWCGIPTGLLSTSLLIMNNIRDIPTDQKSGKWTLPARFGLRFGLMEFAFSLILAIGIAVGIVWIHFQLLYLFTLFPLYIYTYLIIRRAYLARSREEYLDLLSITAKYQWLFGILFGSAILLGTQ
ncbi:MAG: 1,4-dihydroxy-2-naphthoate octaprenyltransferase [bacterium]|nr:1,4-dihydroxy-2-naphthoate octaprenyltransferase [bacterium]